MTVPKEYHTPEGLRTLANFLRSQNGVKVRSGIEHEKTDRSTCDTPGKDGGSQYRRTTSGWSAKDFSLSGAGEDGVAGPSFSGR